MIPLRNGIAVMTLAMVLPTMSSMAQSPGITLEDYTSSISSAKVNSNSIYQQVGAPLDMAELLKGDDVLRQGMFEALAGSDRGNLSYEDFMFGDAENVALAYDATLRSLTIAVPDELLGSRLLLVNMQGEAILSAVVDENITKVDLSFYAPGIYMAGVATQNSIIKSLKFNLK